jgi:hypothetical protein
MLSNHTVGNIGLYYVCYRLSRLGWNVMPTSRNAKGVDVIAYSEDGSSILTFQVKALSKRNAVSLGRNPAHFIADFLIVCRYVQTDEPECFILPKDDAKRLCHPSGKEDNVSYWLEAAQYEGSEFPERWDRVSPPAPPQIPATGSE